MKLMRVMLVVLCLCTLQNVFAQRAPDYFQTAREAFYNEEYTNAIVSLKKALDINPHYTDALYLASQVYYQLENYEYAFSYISKALDLAKHSKEFEIFSAEIEIKLKRFAIAEAKLKRILTEDPLNVRAFNDLVDIYLLTERGVLAKDTLLEILKSTPHNPDALMKISAYYEKNNPKKAEEYFKTNIQYNSLNDEVFFAYSKFLYLTNSIPKALEQIITAISIKPRSVYYEYQAKYHLYLKQPDEALKIYQEQIRQKRFSGILYFNVAQAYYQMSNFSKAVEYLTKSISLSPDDETACFFLDRVLIEKFAVNEPLRIKRSSYYYNQALEAKRAARFEQYMFYLRNSIALNPKNSKARGELGSYFKAAKFPERYIHEMNLIYQITKSKDLAELLEMEKRGLGSRLGVQWQVNQYNLSSEVTTIPLYINANVNNYHYDIESLYSYLLEFASYGKYNYEVKAMHSSEKSEISKMNYAKENAIPYFLILELNEIENTVEIELNLYNANTNEIIATLHTFQSGNDKIINSSTELLRKLSLLVPFKAKIIKISGDKALINAGRKHGVALRNNFLVIKNQQYSLEQGKSEPMIDRKDIKGTAVVIKVDENMSEIKYKDKENFKTIDVNDLVVPYKK